LKTISELKINISLDYDNTYTKDPKFWDDFISNAHLYGHKVFCVTMRYEALGNGESLPVYEAMHDRVDGIFFTSRKAKRDYMSGKGISIDVWIDDCPDFISMDAA
jgi:hypothetical protein